MQKFCQDCCYYEAFVEFNEKMEAEEEDEQGFCRRHSPMPISQTQGATRFPIVGGDFDWCGDLVPIETKIATSKMGLKDEPYSPF